ncbi:cytochrome b [Roseinatronobacter sp. NSM]|uniref:cytochrome b n=1 Tax=Roseinatronobacter sp. NSM TaxID=3457785 RepID=UPI00403581AD
MPAAPTHPRRYAPMTRTLHWVVAVMVIAMLPVGAIMVSDGLARPTQDVLFILHKNGGVVILALVIMRLAWRARNPAPPMPAGISPLQAGAARAAHWALYALLLVMAISGYIRVRAGGFPIEMLDALGLPTVIPRSDALAQTAKTIHANARFALAGLILVHIGAAMMHLMRRDGVFGRIWPPFGKAGQ